jgi:hypothetical protein
MIELGGYTTHQICNMDETRLFWKKGPDRTYISEEEKKMPVFEAVTCRIKRLVGGNTDRSHNLKPCVTHH